IGFAIPSAIVQKVVPVLIQKGHYEHPWLGISGTSLQPDLAKAMGLKADQRGALVVDVVPGSPADKAGIHGSDRQVTIEGMTVRVGGDVITAIDGRPIEGFDDLVTYLARNTEVGQTITLTLLRQGKEVTTKVTLAARPKVQSQESRTSERTAQGAWLGIMGVTVTPDIAQAMELPKEQKGVLVEQVVNGSPADKAGLHGSYKPVIVNGQQLLVGGDIITAVDGQPVTGVEELRSILQQYHPGQKATLTIVRDGKQVDITVMLGERRMP
ncbi:MAG: PDZ domain-containing protein, partial [Anaerolineae bacterium]|nr:PDZ domain-containing protein [Anaerolineae bacterium]